jgi:hypothetical protein
MRQQAENLRGRIVLSVALASTFLGVVTAEAICSNPTQGPDVIVGSLYDDGSSADSYTSAAGVNGLQAYAIGTKSLNIGNEDLEWFSGTNRHPVIGQQMYRYEAGDGFGAPAGRLQMIGMSWLKHGFTALAQTEFCGGSCTFESGHGSGAWLGMGCSDPYSASLNGGQNRLGPRGQVNAFTGYYPYSSNHAAGTAPTAINKRLQVPNEDVDPALNANALYFVEGQYVNYDDAQARNGLNNASYRQISFDSDLNFEFAANSTQRCPWSNSTSATNCALPAIYAWKELDPEVRIEPVDVPGEGRLHVAERVLFLGSGVWRYEYAIHNLNSDRSVRAFTVEFPGATEISSQGFHDVPHHSGDCLAVDPPSPTNNACGAVLATDEWTIDVDEGAGSISWSTDEFATKPEANALRWGTMFNFWFDADRPPSAMNLSVTLFKPGTPSIVEFVIPLFEDGFETGSTIRWSDEGTE